jgi:signal transduction histidine kinase
MILEGDVGKVIPGQKKYLDEINQGNHRMIDLVDALLNTSRIELGTFKSNPKPTDVIILAQSVLDEQKPTIKEKKLTVIDSFSKDIPIFSIDPELLRMVFQNLLANAVAYTPEGGKINFSISMENPSLSPGRQTADKKSKKTILVKVADTGYGIPENQQDKIFTKLFRADNARTIDNNGTGLGLYIVKSIVENSSGKIWFESPSKSALGGESSKNPGTTFYVTFPLESVK